MHRLLPALRDRSRRGAAGSSRIRGLHGARVRGARGAGALVAAAGLAAIGLTAPAGTVASAAVRPARAAAAVPVRHVPALPAPLSAQQPLGVPRASKLPSGVRRVCPAPRRVGQMECMSLVRTNTRHYVGVVPHVTPTGYGPTDLQSAYNLTAASGSGGLGQTVAVVDAYDDPNAAADLAVYRTQYSLPACNTGTGAGCVTKVNEQGQPSPLPSPDPTQGAAWAKEISLDLDMVSAICPNCRILLVEASTNGLGDLGTADNTAVTLGAKFVANSWNGAEFSSESYYDNVYFNHPGVAITFASGDSGYATGWPSASQYVTSVGGTTLTPVTGGGWSETAWSGTGSGCTSADPKPSWQTADDTSPGGCLNRTQNDVAAVADPTTGVASYDTYGTSTPGWSDVGGTSVGAPIIASVYALAGTPVAGTYPASYPYLYGGTGLNDVTSGSNGSCEPDRQYLCNAETGYDGPTGLGTPNGTSAFAVPSTVTGDVITLADPGVQDLETGTPVYLVMRGTDSGTGQTLSYSATGLPPGLKIAAATGKITGTLTSTAGTHKVTVTATDSTGAKGSVKFSMVVIASLRTDYHGVSGPVLLDLGGKCLDDRTNSTTNGNKVQIYTCNGTAAQNWEYLPDGNPGGAGTVTIHGKCLDVKGGGTANETLVDLYSCDGAAGQQWLITGSSGQLYNPVSGKCLADPGGTTINGTQVWIYNCTNKANQAWIPPASPVQSGVTGKCMDDPGNGTSNGNKIQVWSCSTGYSQRWTTEPDTTLRINGKCLTVVGSSKLDGAQVELYTCNSNNTTNGNQRWSIGSNGQLINANSGRCLDDPGNSTVNGTKLVQEDCYGLPGEIWAVT